MSGQGWSSYHRLIQYFLLLIRKKKPCPIKKYQGYILSVKHSIDQSLYVMRVDSWGWDYRFWPLSQDSGTLFTLIMITDHQRWASEKEPPLFCSDLWSTSVNQGHRLTNLILSALYRLPIKRQTWLCRLLQYKLERAFTRVKAEPYRPGRDRCRCVRHSKWNWLWLLHQRPRKIDSVALRKDILMKTQSHACGERRARCIFGPKFIFLGEGWCRWISGSWTSSRERYELARPRVVLRTPFVTMATAPRVHVTWLPDRFTVHEFMEWLKTDWVLGDGNERSGTVGVQH